MKTFPLQSLTIIEAQQKQFALVIHNLTKSVYRIRNIN